MSNTALHFEFCWLYSNVLINLLSTLIPSTSPSTSRGDSSWIFYHSPQCREDEFKCESSGLCVPGALKCDGQEDCDDGSDEDSCTAAPPTTACSHDEFQCVTSGTCVPISWHCDSVEDCSDGSDEANCPLKPSCEEGKLQCLSSGDCVPSNWRCDGFPDCQDGSDEEDCTEVVKDECKDSPCSHGCLEASWHTQGFLCICPDGMTLLAHDRHTCVQRGTEDIKGINKNIKG
uniref:EGF-like domain-containing protein n=1 Tax=Scylla olivacea TaxID=85551 RepID=A0A0P4WJ22_SCYOL